MTEPTTRRTWGIQSGLLASPRTETPPTNKPRTPAPATPTPPAAPTPPDPDATAPTTPEPARKPDNATAQRRPAHPVTDEPSRETGPIKRVAFRLTPELRERVINQARRHDVTHAAIVVQAITAQAGAGRLAPPPTAPQGGLFSYNGRARRTSHITVPFEVRLPESDVATLDTLVADHGWTSRTELITTALEGHLNQG